MTPELRLAVVGVGNNISALLQGIYFYRQLGETGCAETLPGVKRPTIGGIGVEDVRIVAAFDVNPDKIGKDLLDGVLTEPNNYPRLELSIPHQDVTIRPGLTYDSEPARRAVADAIIDAGAEVLLYSLPTGLQWAADAYAHVAVRAGVGYVNCTPEVVARSPETLALFQHAGLPLIGDDLASHLGTSVVHRALLSLFVERGITLESSYQLNFGGNEDFRNLRENGGSKKQSKLNALAQLGLPRGTVEIIPSAGYIPQLKDRKVAVLNVEGQGWAGTHVSLDVKLDVQDSSNAAGVIIDLIRIAGVCRRVGVSGFPIASASCLKSPAVGHDVLTPSAAEEAAAELEVLAAQSAAL